MKNKEDHIDVIHFTSDAADPLNSSSARGVRFLPLADGNGDSHLRCLHLQRGAALRAPSITRAAALLVVHGRINVITQFPFSNIQLHAGMGAIFAGASDEQLDALSRYGAHIGLAFQIVDDILDVVQSSEALGKTAGKDAAQHKITFPAVYGLDESRRMAEQERRRAHEALLGLGDSAQRLRELADLIVERTA